MADKRFLIDKSTFRMCWQMIVVCVVVGMGVAAGLPKFVQANRVQSFEVVFLPFVSIKGVDHVVINEVLASNGSVNMDASISRFEDWIELYNPTSEPADLTGHYLSDDPEQPNQWQFPDGTMIAPRDYLTISAMGFEKEGLYTNFKLSDNGETVVLSAPDGTVVDILPFDEQKGDISFGRLSDGSERAGYFGVPSPGMANGDGLLHQDRNKKPEFSHSSGFYSATVAITLSSAADTQTYYTVDGSIPTEQSPKYTGVPIIVTGTTVVKARRFSDGEHPSRAVAATYLISETSELPVVSIGINPEYMWDDHVGMYADGTNGRSNGHCTSTVANWNRTWERPISIEMFEPDGRVAFSENAGSRISGCASRQNPQKSLAIFFRDQYGDDTVDYPIFADGVTKHHSLILRTTSGDWRRAMMRDAVAQDVLASEMDWDGQRTRPAILLINGAYWGYYNIRDKANEAYLEEKYGFDKDEIDILDRGQIVVEGSADHYLELVEYIRNHDMTNPAVYAYIDTQMETSQFIDYQIGQIFFDNRDWPDNNIRYWRPQQEDGRWRWLTVDLDLTMSWWEPDSGANHNTLDVALDPDLPLWADNKWATFMLRNLMENDLFRNEFLQRFSLYLDYTLTSEQVNEVIGKYEAYLEPEMERQYERWYTDWWGSAEGWNAHVKIIQQFADERPDIMRSHLEAYYGIGSERIAVDLNVGAGAGTIEVSTVRVTDGSETIRVYPGRPVTLRAIPAPNHAFVRWEGAVMSDLPQIDVILQDGQAVTAIFEPFPQPVINEIHYNPSGDLQGDDGLYEFIELYNPYDSAIDVTGYQLTDGVAFTFTEETIMPPNSTIVLAQTADTYADLSVPVFQWDSGGLKNSGETIELSDAAGFVVDDVPYSDEGDWVVSADGDGFSLSLIAPSLDNAAGENWQASTAVGGTPGAEND